MTDRVLVTGASGFIGQALVEELATGGHRVRAAMRQPADVFSRGVEVVAVSDLTRPVEWRFLLKDIDTVVHLAGIAFAGPGIADETLIASIAWPLQSCRLPHARPAFAGWFLYLRSAPSADRSAITR